MVARVENELLSPALLTPRPDPTDSDEVLLAIETARTFEMQGEIREAARWLRRAADEAEMRGNDERVLVFARAAADMSNVIGSFSEAPTVPPPSPGVIVAGAAEYPPATPLPESFEATIPPPASPSLSLPPTFPTSTTIPCPSDMPFTERSMRIGAIRVAILESQIRGAKSFFVERLERGQAAPAGATEAMLVFSGEAESSDEQDFDLLAASDSSRPSPPND